MSIIFLKIPPLLLIKQSKWRKQGLEVPKTPESRILFPAGCTRREANSNVESISAS